MPTINFHFAFTGVSIACVVICCTGCFTGSSKVAPSKPIYPTSHEVGYDLIRQREGWQAGDFFTNAEYLKICDAISRRDDVQLKALLAPGMDFNVQGRDGFTLLYWAFVEHNLSAFKILLERGANPDLVLSETIKGKVYVFIAKDNILYTSLHCMRSAFCEAALPYSQDVNYSPVGNKNLFQVHFSTQLPNESTVRALIAAGVDVNSIGAFGYTPCHFAASSCIPEICIPLIEAGSDPNVRNEEGYTVLEMLERERANQPQNNPDYAPRIAAIDRVIAWLRTRQQEQPSAD